MGTAAVMVEVWRGPILESLHRGHVVVCDAEGSIRHAWGDPEHVILPRSSCKMVQALPLVESGAADAAGLTQRHLALACASHQGSPVHTDLVTQWLAEMGMSDEDLRCGPQMPGDREAFNALIRGDRPPCQVHNNCSGKHSGFLTLGKHLGAGPEYIDPEHPVQELVREAFEDVTGLPSPGLGIDGCSAPNFATTVRGLARAMARFASARIDARSLRAQAMARLVEAMCAHPELVAGEGRACTELMRAMRGRGALKTGAEGVFTAILPEQGLGVAIKIEDGATRASECALAEVLVILGALDPEHPAAVARRNPPVVSRRGITAGVIRPAMA